MMEAATKPKFSLQALRERQAANPPPIVQTEDGPTLVAPKSETPTRVHTPDGESLVGGFLRIFPDTFQTAREIPESWKLEFWSCPSPWCKVDGMPEHPEFAANAKGIFP